MTGIRTVVWLAGTWALVSAQAALAAEVTQVLSARSLKDFDVALSVDWFHEQTRGPIKRESVEATSTALASDVVYHQVRDSLRLRGEVGLVHDLSFFLVGSIVLADNRGLDFDGLGVGPSGDCASASSLLRDKILPCTQGTSWGLDAENNRPFKSPSNQVWSGPTRSGLEYLGLGLRWAAMNQARDQTKPTWILGLETRLSVAGDQRFDPGKPTANRDVGVGYHQLILSTMFSRKFGTVEPYLGGWFMQPFLTSDSVFRNVGTGSYGSAQRRAGGEVGLEATLWDAPKLDGRIALEVAGRLEFRFEGLAQSELWEILSPNPGVLRSPAYGLSGGNVGLSGHIGRHARLRASFGMLFQEAHFLTDGGSGSTVYDIPGRRFKTDVMYSWHVLVNAAASF